MCSKSHHQYANCYVHTIVSSVFSYSESLVVDRQNGQCPFWRTCSSKSSTWKTCDKT